jgi:hypothetical protein
MIAAALGLLTSCSDGRKPSATPQDQAPIPTSGSRELLDTRVSTQINAKKLPRVVFEPGQDRFLVVWNEQRNRNDFDYHGWTVYGQLIGSTGNLDGQDFAISSFEVEYRTAPVIAHDANTGKSLVVWETTGGDILGQMINSDGSLSGNVISIANTGTIENTPALAFDPVSSRYLVGWIASDTAFSIHGQLLTSEGVLDGTSFQVSNVSSGKLELKASLNSQTDTFLLVWRDYRGEDIYSIRGQMVNNDGTLQGTEIDIADTSGSQVFPDVVYDSINDYFLVTWSDGRRSGYDIYGQLVAPDGVLIGSNFYIAPYGGRGHAVSFDPFTARYFFAFSKSGNQIQGQSMAADGYIRDEVVLLSDDIEVIQQAPHLAHDSNSGKFLIAWEDHRNESNDIYGRTTTVTVTQEPCDGQNSPSCLECETEAGALVDQACPVDGNYSSHGNYVGCVAQATAGLRSTDQIGASCALQLIDSRSRSQVGNP